MHTSTPDLQGLLGLMSVCGHDDNAKASRAQHCLWSAPQQLVKGGLCSIELQHYSCIPIATSDPGTPEPTQHMADHILQGHIEEP